MVVVLANQDLIMPDQAPAPPAPNANKTAAPAVALSPSRLAAVVEAKYILDVRRR
jgi:hypothetical protein